MRRAIVSAQAERDAEGVVDLAELGRGERPGTLDEASFADSGCAV